MKTLILLCFVWLIPFSISVGQDKLLDNENNKLFVNPKETNGLPKEIIQYLLDNDYLIPKHNSSYKGLIRAGFRGQFIQPHQEDWVVLASRNKTSLILIFANGSTNNVTELARTPNKPFFFRTDEQGNTGFLRHIGIEEIKDMIEKNRQLFGNEEPEIDHLGIDDTLSDGSIIIHYFYKGRWLRIETGWSRFGKRKSN